VPRVAVVHPKHVMRALTAQILEQAGFVPIEGETAEDALAVTGADPPALAIIDERLVEDLPRLSVPWIALGRSRAPHAPLLAAGACCVVEKPFSPEDLLRAVTWALDVYDGGAARPVRDRLVDRAGPEPLPGPPFGLAGAARTRR
jgi:DNA-binding response OmpR family regulator